MATHPESNLTDLTESLRNDVRRLGRDSVYVRNALAMFQRGDWTWEHAMMKLVLAMSASLTDTQDRLVLALQRETVPRVIILGRP